jgi:hypothetical protein
MNIAIELDKYHRNVKKHYTEYLEIQRIWVKICNYLYLNAGQVSRMLETENIAEYGPGTFISKTL